ncbi:unnamed protein product [Cylindrotheca closterium]|uniref:Leucine-rich repeat-containing N-terminal plant-type domain-containing protein n=1 Tax=Cylindrotheca closterium TaxID=2856 RepID=A0AAD2G4Y0_9STRA|nr:unnamed protein product [Cylindrotheca closterium]
MAEYNPYGDARTDKKPYDPYGDDGEGPGDEMTYDIEHQSTPSPPAPVDIKRPSPPTTHEAIAHHRVDSTGLPVPPPPRPSPETTAEVPPPVQVPRPIPEERSIVPEETPEEDALVSPLRSPPRSSVPVKSPPKTPDTVAVTSKAPPKTPDTVFSTDESEAKSGVDTLKHSNRNDIEGDTGSDDGSHSSDIKETSSEEREKGGIMPTKCLIIALMLMVVFLIIALITVFLVLSGDDISVPAASEFNDWSSLRPTMPAPIAPSVPAPPTVFNRPTQGPTMFGEPALTLTPTTTNTREVVTASPSAIGQTLPPTGLATTASPTQRTTPSPTQGTTPSPTQRITAVPGEPTPAPTFPPTPGPTPNPTPVPTPGPTLAPTPRPTPSPTRAISDLPPSPGGVFEDVITDFLFDTNNVIGDNVDRNDLAVQKSVRWLANEADAAGAVALPLDEKYLQRFGILMLYFSIDPNILPSNTNTARLPHTNLQGRDECTWIGMSCDATGMLTGIKLHERELDGTLPVKWEFFQNLRNVDLSGNKLRGSIPEELYDLLALEGIYLYKNELSGTISSKIGQLWSLRMFLLNHNRLTGSIPADAFASTPDAGRFYQLRNFNVHRNQMTGSIPSNTRLRQLRIFDIGRNQFSGQVPEDFGREAVRLRHLYLDHNKFTGTFPSAALNAGDGFLSTLFINDNEFTGTFPGDHKSTTAMIEMTIQNNNFVTMQRNATCDLDVFSGGELVEFKSDCLICRCGFALMCRYCSL